VGRGFWKFNGSLLNDAVYVNNINNLIEQCKINYADIENKSLLLDLIKCDIRGATISYATYKAKCRREQELKLQEKLIELEEQLDNMNPDKDIQNQYNKIKSDIETINELKGQGAIIRSKANWIESGEKCTSYFLKLENSNYNIKHIKSLIVDDSTITNPTEILKEQQSFYENLYSEKNHSDKCEQNCELFTVNSNKLNDTDKTYCDSELTLQECTESLRKLPNNKTPGSDGFTTNFYKFFWSKIKTLVYDSFQYSFKTGEMSIDQRRAIINLQPKPNKDIRYLKNWRPISLLNTDYKILTKSLANRLQTVIPTIISEDQTGYVKGRYIGENIRSIIDILEHTSFKHNPGLMIFLDFEKAFDSLSWSFLNKTLSFFNFGENFISWIKTIYKNITACVTNNGYSTEFFQIKRGIRQGCPISALLFILTAEIMSLNMKEDKSIAGIKFKNKPVLLTQFADDTTLFLQDVMSLNNVLKLLQHFYVCSGLKLNATKTEAMFLGATNNMNINHTKMKIVEETRVLGITLKKNIKDLTDFNFTEKLHKVKMLLNMWKSRHLTIKGKITLLQNKVLPLILYTASILHTPHDIIEKFDKLLFDFIWPNGKHHVKKNALIQTVSDGGLNMPDLFSKIVAIKLTWIKRLIDKDSNYINIAKTVSKIDDFNLVFSHNLNSNNLSAQPTSFYKQIIDYWALIKHEPITPNEILNEKLLLNKHITVNGKTVNFRSLRHSNVTLMKDILKQDYTLKSKDELVNNGVHLTQLQYNSIVTAIPKKWLKTLKNYSDTFIEIEDKTVKIDGSYQPISTIRCKTLYRLLVKQKYVRSTSLEKWEENYYYVNFDWAELFKIPYKNCRETYIQSMQYQIILRYFPCNYNVNIWFPIESKKCVMCNDVDTIEHFFYDCNPVKKLWLDFMNWFESLYGVTFTLGRLDIIFGILNENDITIFRVLNFCILYGKHYIKKKKLSGVINLQNFLINLSQRICVEKFIASENGLINKFLEQWEPMYSTLQNIYPTTSDIN
jgi:hypothetical protein